LKKEKKQTDGRNENTRRQPPKRTDFTHHFI